MCTGDPTTFGNLEVARETLDAVRESLENGKFNGYGHSTGLLEARAAVCEYVKDVQGQVEPNDVVLCSGCSSSLDMCIAVLAGPGQNILIPRPGFSIYRTLALGHGVECRSYDLLPDRNWEADLQQIESLIDQNTAALVVTNPSNPCGSVFTRKHLQNIVNLAEKYFVPIIADEIYEHFVFPGIEYVAVSALSKTVPVLSCGGLTKRFLVPGWRLGWIVVHDRNDVLKDVHQGLENLSTRILGGNSLVQGALPAILKNTPQSFFDNLINILYVSVMMMVCNIKCAQFLFNFFFLFFFSSETCNACIRYPEGGSGTETNYARWSHVHDDWHRCGTFSRVSDRVVVRAGFGERAKCILFAGTMFRLSELYSYRTDRTRRHDC